MSEILDDLKHMTVNTADNKIILDLRKCSHVCSGRIVLLIITRFQQDVRSKEKARTVEVKVSDSDARYFRISEQIDAFALQEQIFKDRILQGFGKMT